jgi:flagellin
MPITINTNVSALTAQRNLGISSARSAQSLSKLSSGSRVPTAKDDAAALAVGTGLRADVAAYRTAQLNAQQGAALLQVADGAFSQITDILVRMKTLASQAQSGQISDTERGFLDTEYQELLGEIDRIAGATEFNGTTLLGGASTVDLNAQGANVETADGFVAFSFDSNIVAAADNFHVFWDDSTGNFTLTNGTQGSSQTISLGAGYTVNTGETRELNFSDLGVRITLNDQFNTGGADIGTLGGTAANETFDTVAGAATAGVTINIQVGIGTTAAVDQVSVAIAQGSAAQLGVGGTSISTAPNADTASGAIDTALGSINTARSQLGAGISRLEFAGNNAAVAVENLSAAKSVLLDVDVSMEITEFSSQQVLIQAGVSMLAQANQQPSLLLRLLQ